MKDFEKIAALGSILSKKYATSLFRLLRDYKSISASEASSRLDLHIQTVQEFLESTTLLGITGKEEVFERKRPYFRYTIQNPSITYNFDLDELVGFDRQNPQTSEIRIRENRNAKSHFTTARNGKFFSSVSIISGSGRESEQRKINLTQSQGLFLFHLPFPDALPDSIEGIMAKAKIETEYRSEIDNLVNELIELRVIERVIN